MRENAAAWAYFCRHRTWKPAASNGVIPRRNRTNHDPQLVHRERDLTAVRRRYAGLTKTELIERLIAVEQAYTERDEQWLRLNDQLVIWRQRAELAERCCTAQGQD